MPAQIFMRILRFVHQAPFIQPSPCPSKFLRDLLLNIRLTYTDWAESPMGPPVSLMTSGLIFTFFFFFKYDC